MTQLSVGRWAPHLRGGRGDDSDAVGSEAVSLNNSIGSARFLAKAYAVREEAWLRPSRAASRQARRRGRLWVFMPYQMLGAQTADLDFDEHGPDRLEGSMKHSRVRVASVMVALVGMTLGLAACGGGSAGDQKTIRFGIFAGPGVTLAHDITDGLGAYKEIEEEFDIKFEFSVFQTPAPMTAGLSSGQLDFAIIGNPNPMFNAVNNPDAGIVNIVNLLQGVGGLLIASNEHESKGSGLASLADYNGTTWALTALAGPSQVGVQAAVDAAGGDDKSLEFQAVGITAIGPAVSSGRVDGGVAGPVQGAGLIKAGKATGVLNMSGPEAHEYQGDFPNLGLMTTNEFAQKNRDLTQALVTAQISSLLYLKDHADDPSAVYALEPASFREQQDLETWTLAWPYFSGAVVPVTGLVTHEDVVEQAAFMAKYGLLPSDFKVPSDLTDTSFVENAYKELGKTVPTESVDQALLSKVPNS